MNQPPPRWTSMKPLNECSLLECELGYHRLPPYCDFADFHGLSDHNLTLLWSMSQSSPCTATWKALDGFTWPPSQSVCPWTLQHFLPHLSLFPSTPWAVSYAIYLLFHFSPRRTFEVPGAPSQRFSSRYFTAVVFNVGNKG
ncbi:hypothetical protein, unlikely [Trypanosoma congolense IL3000]|uniref:Uncharacterized protein n=1 Tax=Trypanosoma congolense (strain IL3000) TaxID=1068625 RepID=F9WB83_TRYCI|nr:hypothetical protein, unlikely [Trypanosoma congolense IL3000]